jgi:hypothetical protein
MKRILMILALFLLASIALADEPKKEDDYNSVREFKNKVFDVHNRDARQIAQSIKLLGSGFKGSGMSVNEELHTITVRDFPENVAAIEEAIKRLDHSEVTPDLELKIAVLIGSKTPITAAEVPEELQAVVKQLQSTVRYSHYGLLTATVHRTKPGNGIENSGVAEPALLGMNVKEGNPIFYTYRLRQISIGGADKPTINIEDFNFSMRMPILTGMGIQYQNVGFNTPVSIRQNEKVVIGTTTMGEKALIVVVTANVIEAK